MKNINHTTPKPGTVVRLVYVAKDGKLTERLVFIVRADATHWRGTDLVKGEPRRFRREGLVVAEQIDTLEQQQVILARLFRTANPNA